MSTAIARRARGAGRLSIPRQILSGALFWVLAAVPLFLAWRGLSNSFLVIGTVRASEQDEAGKTEARVVVGRLRSAPRPSPSWGEPMLFASRVGHTTGSGKNRRFVTDCFLTSLDGMTVEDNRTHEIFEMTGFEGKSGGFQKGLPFDEPRRVTVDLPRHTSRYEVPKAVADWCKGQLVESYSTEFEEASLPIDEVVTVRGCPVPERPNVLRPCLDGRDVITSRSLAAVRAATKDEQAAWSGIGGGGLFVSLLLLGLFARKRRVMSRPEGQPDVLPIAGGAS